MSVLLGFITLKRKRTGQLAYLSETAAGKKGHHFVRDLVTLDAVRDVGGDIAVEQLRRLARQCVERLFLLGLVTRQQLHAVASTETVQRPPEAPKVALLERPYFPVAVAAPARRNIEVTEEAWKP